MKKILMIMLVLAGMSVRVNAQWFVSGSAGIGYLNDEFHLLAKPGAGYEFDDRWAVGLDVGLGVRGHSALAYLIVDPYVRFNCWNNNKFFIDAKVKSEMWIGHGNGSIDLGVVPSFRYAINDYWHISGDVGLFGAQYMADEWSPAFGFSSANVKMSVIYRF